MAFDILTGEGGWIALGSNDHGDDGWEEKKKKMEREDETVKSYLFYLEKEKEWEEEEDRYDYYKGNILVWTLNF